MEPAHAHSNLSQVIQRQAAGCLCGVYALACAFPDQHVHRLLAFEYATARGCMQDRRIDEKVASLLQIGTQAAERGNTADALHSFDQLLFYRPRFVRGHEMRAQVTPTCC
jgi:hypothetical protein